MGAVDGPLRARCAGGHVEALDVAVVGQDKELLAIVGPYEGLGDPHVGSDFDINESAAMLTVVDPNLVVVPRGNEVSVG